MGATKSLLGVCGVAAAAWMAVPEMASAQLESCGNIHIDASASCEFVTSGGCETQCEPVSFQAACAAQLTVDCEGDCTAEASVDCTATCEADCTATCEVDPGNFDCQAGCTANIEAECEGQCEADEDSARCEASCTATYEAECSASCTGTPPTAECDAKCEASCSGGCEAEANVDCNVECQSELYADCETELMGGCMTQCEEPMGALFCDDQYVDYGDNAAECLQALAELEINVDGSFDCEGGTCVGEASAGCAVSHGTSAQALPVAIGAFGLMAVAVRRRRR